MRRLASEKVQAGPDGAASAADDPGARWMLGYQRGDESAFDLLVEQYSPRVYALLTRFLGPTSNREDLVQEVFLRVIRARERYVPEARFSTWLYTIVFRLCVNETELHRTARAFSEREEDAGEREDGRCAPPEHELVRGERERAVRAAIAALPERQRMALVLAKYEGLAYNEVARVLGSSEKAIKSMIHRARESLRARLAPFLEGEVA